MKTKNYIYSIFVFVLVLTIGTVSAGLVTHGPIVGAVTSSSARVVVRAIDEVPVVIQFDTSELFTAPILSDEVVAMEDSNFFAITQVSGLEPNTKYYSD